MNDCTYIRFSLFERLFKKKMFNTIFLSIAYLKPNILSYFWQFVDSIPNELRRLGS